MDAQLGSDARRHDSWYIVPLVETPAQGCGLRAGRYGNENCTANEAIEA